MDDIVNICPSIYYSEAELNNEVLGNYNFKILINCLPTIEFLKSVRDNELIISSDIIIVSIDLNFNYNELNSEDRMMIDEFHSRYNKILQNFINYFVIYNKNFRQLINKLPNNLSFDFKSPILTGNLRNNLFKIIRLINLIKIMNDSIDILITGSSQENISKSLMIGYLMDNYNYNLNNCVNYLQMKINLNFNMNFYNDLLILESLKKFYIENNDIKLGSEILYYNKTRKRGVEEEDGDRKRLNF